MIIRFIFGKLLNLGQVQLPRSSGLTHYQSNQKKNKQEVRAICSDCGYLNAI